LCLNSPWEVCAEGWAHIHPNATKAGALVTPTFVFCQARPVPDHAKLSHALPRETP
jgi:hypothetical protein